MSTFAPAAVYFKTDWLGAYDFVGHKVYKRVKKLHVESNPDKALAGRLMEKAIHCFQKCVEKEPDLNGLYDWIRKNMLLEGLYTVSHNLTACNEIYRRVADVQRHITQKYHLDDLGFEFIPRVIPLGSIGVYENLDVYVKAGLLGLRPNKKMFLMQDPHTPVVNPSYLRYWRKHVTVISDPALIEALSPLEKYLTRQIVSFMPLHDQIYRSCLTLGIIREQWLKENRPPILSLSREDYQRGWHCLRSLGVPEDAWFVCLHVRDGGTKDAGSRAENFRNADITTYIPAIKAVTDAGGWVIRIGDPGMRKLAAMPRVIDYAHSGAKSDWMDIFLCAQCRFMIGTASGMYNVALAFGVPVIMTNLLPARAIYFFSSQVTFIPRLCWSKSKKDYLSFKELIAPPVGMTSSQSRFDDMHIQIIANQAEEIREVVEEMLEQCAGILRDSEEDQALQKRFRDMTADCGKLFGDLKLVAHARIGRKFLRKYASLLPAEMAEESLIGGEGGGKEA